jgi:hypothetical protein
MNRRESVRKSRRYQVRLDERLSSELETFATTHGLGSVPAIRLLLSRGLKAEGSDANSPQDSPAALAGLVAAEHAVLMVASVLPEGERRMHELAPQAAVAAEERLAVMGTRAGD